MIGHLKDVTSLKKRAHAEFTLSQAAASVTALDRLIFKEPLSATFKMPKLIELDTPRLHMRQWHSDDKKPFAHLNADPRVMEFFPSCLDRPASDAMVERLQSLIADRGWGFWAVEILGGANFIGFVGLHVPTAQFPFAPCVEVGWRLAYEHWGNGYATEAATAALQFGFETLNLPEIVSFTALQNNRSRSVMCKLKMQPDSNTFKHPSLPVGHALREHCLYRLSRENWFRAKHSTKSHR
jgi:RimJ/RimL family protein N-acetyltransferase